MSRSRALSARDLGRVDVVASGRSSSSTYGALAADHWIRNFTATPPTTTRWHVEIALDVVTTRAPSEWDETTSTRFHLDIYAEEWGFYVCHVGQSSWIRVTDVPFVHGRDDFKLLPWTPALSDIGRLLHHVEQTHSIRFQREHATIRTNVAGIEPSVRSWIATL
jgi:hypothetical protein